MTSDDQQPQTNNAPDPTAWGQPIGDERQAQLQAMLDAWNAPGADHGGKKGPFDRKRLTGADVCWLAVQSGWDGKDQYAPVANLHLEGADLTLAHLEGAHLFGAHLEGANLSDAHLEGANLRLAFFDEATTLNGITLGDIKYGYVAVADVRWGGVNLAVVNWPEKLDGRHGVLGDERAARQAQDELGKPKSGEQRLQDYRDAVRANRQLAVALQNQGLNEEAGRFAFRAQTLQRQVLLLQRKYGSYLFSLLIAALSGYGYRLWRIFAAYLLIVTVFAAGFLVTGHTLYAASISWQSVLQGVADAFQISLNAIHGRVFFAQFGLDTVQSWFATAESIFGIVIEGVFVAMLIQRFFGR